MSVSITILVHFIDRDLHALALAVICRLFIGILVLIGRLGIGVLALEVFALLVVTLFFYFFEDEELLLDKGLGLSDGWLLLVLSFLLGLLWGSVLLLGFFFKRLMA